MVVKPVSEVHWSFCITSIVGSELIPASLEAAVSSIVDPVIALSDSFVSVKPVTEFDGTFCTTLLLGSGLSSVSLKAVLDLILDPFLLEFVLELPSLHVPAVILVILAPFISGLVSKLLPSFSNLTLSRKLGNPDRKQTIPQ